MTRLLTSTAMAILVASALTVTGVSAQLSAPKAEAWNKGATVTRTPWGHPDLSGVWSSDDMRGIPRERPAEYGTRRFLSDEEYAKRLERDEQTRGEVGTHGGIVGKARRARSTNTCSRGVGLSRRCSHPRPPHAPLNTAAG